jgi:RNA polymerase sigma factor (sigma-70 family)
VKTPSHAVLAYLRSLVHRHADAASDDRELLRRFGERRDDAAFAVLLQRHGPMVLNSARRILCDEQLAEDVFQATFLLLSRKANTIRRAEALPCWLHSVARRLAVRARRAYARRREQETRARLPSSIDPLAELSARELVAVLDDEIGKLPEGQRAVLILCCLEGLSQEEAARRLGCSAAAVKGRLERGRQRLRQQLERRGLTLPVVLGGTILFAGVTSPIPAALAQTTLQAATTGGSPSAAVAALLEEAMRTMFVNKFKAIGAAVLLLAVTGTGVGMMSLRPQAVQESAPFAARDDKPLSADKHVDLYGDPLPEGAVMRLGTTRRRAVGMTLAATADGKSIIGARNSLYLNVWDAATGKLRQKRELPEPWGTSILSSDGRRLAQWSGQEQPLVIWDVQTVKKVRDLGTVGEFRPNLSLLPKPENCDGGFGFFVGFQFRVIMSYCY